MEGVVPSTKSSRTTSANLLCFYYSFYYYGGGRALNQVKPNHFRQFALFLLLIYYGGGRALNQVKPNHFRQFALFLLFVLLLWRWSCPQPSQAEPLPPVCFISTIRSIIMEVVVPSTKSSRTLAEPLPLVILALSGHFD